MIRLLTGDCRELLKELPDGSVHCVVTSPPYWGLRDYGTAKWEGGDPECDHKPSDTPAERGIASSTLEGGQGNNGHKQEGYKDICPRCGALRIDNQIGLEGSPASYVETMVSIFRELWRVLRDDGTLWLNLGDSYASDTKWGGHSTGKQSYILGISGNRKRTNTGLRSKSMVGIPWRVAFALQDEGWILRSDIIWHKPNAMPESVTDRPTKAHEYVFLLTKSERYFYDAEAIREPAAGTNAHDLTGPGYAAPGQTTQNGNRKFKVPGGWDVAKGGHGTIHREGRTEATYREGELRPGRNARSVWTIPTQPYSGAHFATFPEALITPMIKAGTSEKGRCAQCGAPWERVLEREKGTPDSYRGSSFDKGKTLDAHEPLSPVGRGDRTTAVSTTGWRPTCECGADVVACTVLDPFGGAGTTGLVADRLGRNAILIELNPEYCAMQRERVIQDAPLFAEVTQ